MTLDTSSSSVSALQQIVRSLSADSVMLIFERIIVWIFQVDTGSGTSLIHADIATHNLQTCWKDRIVC